MKCFRENTKGGNASNISKMLIKFNYLDILMNSEELLGIKIDDGITLWFYFVIIRTKKKMRHANFWLTNV